MVDDRYSGGLLQTMPNLLIATPDYLLRYDTDLREVFVIEVGRPEYYGISWFPGDDTIFLSHSGLDNNLLQDAMDYANSEVGWISRASENSWPFVSQPHQILCLDDGSLAVTNTGRNCLTIANPADWSIRHHRYGGALWDRLGASDRSGNHFNSLAARNEFLYVVAHNFEKGSYILKLERPSLRLAWISHTPRVTARRYPVFESIINLLQEVGPRSEGDSLFFGLPVRYCARARSN
jgi:hypothetical protein